MFNSLENDIPIITWYLRTQIDNQFKENNCKKVEQNIDGYYVDTVYDDFFGKRIICNIGTLIEYNQSANRYTFTFKANDHSYVADADLIKSSTYSASSLYVYNIVSVRSIDNLYQDKEIINTVYGKIENLIYNHCKPFIADKLLEGDNGYLFDKEYCSIHINSFGNWPTKTFERLIETSFQDSDEFVVLYKRMNSITLQFKDYTDTKYNLVLTYNYDSVDQQDITVNSIRMDIPYIEKVDKK